MRLKIFNISILAIVASLLYSCASSGGSNLTLSDEELFTNIKNVKFNMPKGYFEPLDNEFKNFEFWITNPELNTSFSLSKIYIDFATKKTLPKKSLSGLLLYSQTLHKAELGKNYVNLNSEESFTIDGIECASYSYIGKANTFIRNIIFEYNNSYYELTACSLKKDYTTCFSLQNQIIESIH